MPCHKLPALAWRAGGGLCSEQQAAYPEAGPLFPGLFLVLCHPGEISTFVRAWIAHLQSLDTHSLPPFLGPQLYLALLGIQKNRRANVYEAFQNSN